MTIKEIRICGYGGQGVILSAYVIGRAAAVVEGRHATLNQSFGPEARGSACSAQLLLSDEPISYPYIRQTDVLVAMSQTAYQKFLPELKEEGMALLNDSLVAPDPVSRILTVGAPATQIAEDLGKRMVTNMVMVGLFTAATDFVLPDSVREAIRSSVPPGTEDLNLNAFERGMEAGDQALARLGLEEAQA